MRRPTFRIRRSSYATIAAAAVLVMATSGTSAYAAHLITSKQIKNNTIKSIDVRNGTLTGADMAPGTIPAPYGGTYAYSTFHDAGVNISTQPSPGVDPVVLTLNVPAAGSYTVLATTDLFTNASAVTTHCVLNAGGDSDTKHVGLSVNGSATAGETTALQVVHTFAAPGTATLRCFSFGVNVDASNTKITATKVDHLSNVAG